MVSRRPYTVSTQFSFPLQTTRTCAHQVTPKQSGRALRHQSSQSAPAEFRSDVLEDAFEHVGVVVHTQLVRDREEQRIGRLDSLVAREFFDQQVGFRGVRAAEDGPRVRVDVADLVLVSGVATKYARSRSSTSAKMLRLTDTRGSRRCPASFHASRQASICLRCCTCSGSPVSSSLSVELWRFMPSFAAHLDVALELEPHQIRSRNPSE